MSKESIKSFFYVLGVIVSLYFFLVSIGLMGAAFKGFGKEFAENLIQTTSNPFIGLFIGILATSIIQSSSTTTSIVVGMVASGVMSISNAIPIVMGANIGTTVTNLLVSLGHITRKEEFKRAINGACVHDFFNQLCVLILFPLELCTGFLEKTATKLANIFIDFGGITFTSPIKTITEPAIHGIKVLLSDSFQLSINMISIFLLLLSAIILFFSLFFIVRFMKILVIKRVEVALNNVLGRSGVLSILAGLVFTSIVQSSSITTSLLVPLIGAGIITVEVAFPITLGANIGTTTTAILASFATANPAAITIAFVHFLFNFIGVVIFYPIPFFRKIPLFLAKTLGDIAFIKRRYAIGYVVTLFFILPTVLIIISRMLK